MNRSRVKLLSVFAIVVFSVSAANGQSRRVAPTPTPTPETEKIYTEEVKLNVLAFDEDGNFFSDVKPNDLVITENNILHQPNSVRRIPANVLIVLDTGGEMRSVKNLDQTRKTAAAVVNTLRQGDSIAIMDYSDKPEIVSEWTTDKAQALKAIKRTNFGRRDAFTDALNMARDFLVRDPLENKHLVLITDGTDSGTNPSAKSDAMQRLLATDISVHVISYTAMEATDIEPRTKGISKTPPPKAMPDEVVAQLPNGPRQAAQMPKVGPTINLDRTMLRKLKARKADLEASQDQLDKLTMNTNGEFIVPQTLDEMLEKAPLVSRMIDASYAVTYTPKIPLYEGKGVVERNIEVTSKRPGLVVQARRKLIVDTSN
jgi:VWFA-related protein